MHGFNNNKVMKEERTIMTRKISAMVLTTLLVLGTITGCSGKGTMAPVGDNGITDGSQDTMQNDETQNSGVITLKVWAEEAQHSTVQKMIDSFIEQYKGQADFDITLEAQSDSTTRDVLLGDVQNGADVFSFPDDQLSAMVAGGALAPVPNVQEVKDEMVAEAVAAATAGDTLYAYPMTADNGYFLYYNKDYFTEDDVKTLDSILAVCEENGKKFSMELNSGWYMYSFFGNTGLTMNINDDDITNNCNWNTVDGDIKGIDVAESIVNVISSPGFVSQSDGEWVSKAADGEVIAAISGVWNAVAVKNVWGDDYGACKLPTYTCDGKQIQMASFTGYKMIGVNYYSKNKDWAFKLAQWLTNEQNQTLRFVEQNQGPANKVAAASEEVAKVPAIAAVIEQSQYGVLQRIGNSYWDACTDFIDSLLAGDMTKAQLQEQLDKMVEGITER